MRRRAVVALGVAALLVGGGFVAFRLSAPPPPGVTRANFDRLHNDLTMEEIEAIMGRPADMKIPLALDGEVYSVDYAWYGDEGDIYICDQKGVTLRGGFTQKGASDPGPRLAPAPDSYFTKLRRWLRL